MLILLSDGAGLTSRQVATVLARAGHRVEELSPRGLRLGRMRCATCGGCTTCRRSAVSRLIAGWTLPSTWPRGGGLTRRCRCRSRSR